MKEFLGNFSSLCDCYLLPVNFFTLCCRLFTSKHCLNTRAFNQFLIPQGGGGVMAIGRTIYEIQYRDVFDMKVSKLIKSVMKDAFQYNLVHFHSEQ